MKTEVKNTLNTVLSCSVIVLLGAASVAFAFMYMDATGIFFLVKHKTLLEILVTILISLVTIVSLICQLTDKKFVYKITILTLSLIAFALAGLYVVKVTGLWDKIDSIEKLRDYVASYGAFTVPIFILIQFLQVVALPIPGFITISAGVALFGPFYGSLYSIIGIVSASIVAFFIGRVFGYKVASWLVGAENLDKGLKLVKGKDTVILTFMFLFPFFPDDVLCFVAGLSTMRVPYYLVMITITRVINVVVSSYLVNGSLIPYNTWWGILVWVLIFVAVAVMCLVIYKHGEKIEKYFKSLFSKRKAKKNKIENSEQK